MQKPTLGILAGMGPKSTAPFIDQVVSQCQSQLKIEEDIDFPPMIIYALPTPFSIHRPIDHAHMQKTIGDGLKKLESCKVAFIAMPCITAHLYFDALQKCIQVPLLNMIDATLKAIPPQTKKIALLGTPPTIESGIFQKELEKAGHSVFASDVQPLVNELIAKIKQGIPPAHLHDLWESLLEKLAQNQIDTAVLACTDLNVVAQTSLNASLIVIDSALCLAKKAVEMWVKATNRN